MSWMIGLSYVAVWIFKTSGSDYLTFYKIIMPSFSLSIIIDLVHCTVSIHVEFCGSGKYPYQNMLSWYVFCVYIYPQAEKKGVKMKIWNQNIWDSKEIYWGLNHKTSNGLVNGGFNFLDCCILYQKWCV